MVRLTERQKNLAFIGGGIAALVAGLIVLNILPALAVTFPFEVAGKPAQASVSVKRTAFTPLAAVKEEGAIKYRINIENTGPAVFVSDIWFMVSGPGSACKKKGIKKDKLVGTWEIQGKNCAKYDKCRASGTTGARSVYIYSWSVRFEKGRKRSYDVTVDLGKGTRVDKDANFFVVMEAGGVWRCKKDPIDVTPDWWKRALMIAALISIAGGALAIARGSLGYAGII